MSKATKKNASNSNAAKNNTMINLIIGVIIIVFVAAGVYATYGKISESIRDNAIESGEQEATVEYLAKKSGMSIEDYLAQYGLTLGDTITADTTESEMLDNMTLENYLAYNGDGQTAEEVLEGTGLSDKATKDTLWKDFLPMVPAISIIGEESFNQIKEQLGLSDEQLNYDTTYADFEKLVEEASQDAQEGETSETADETEASEENPTDDGTQTSDAE